MPTWPEDEDVKSLYYLKTVYLSICPFQEEKRAWVEEWERRQEQERAEWRQMERNLRERVYRLESENKEAKDTIENLIAFQQRKNRPE